MSNSEIDSFKSHYFTLRDYLSSFLHSLNNPQNSAQDKLSKLPSPELLKVSTDIHDEINRRLYSPEIPFLTVRTDLIPKRNQARQKMATLSLSRFQELSTQVLFEIQRRFPWMADEYAKSPSPPSNETSTHSDRSTRDNISPAHYQKSIPSNPSIPPPSSKPISSNSLSFDELDRIRTEYEFQISQLQQQLRDNSSQETIKNLQTSLSQQKELNKSNQLKYDRLKQEHEALLDDYKQQQKRSESLQNEMANLISEVKSLNLKNKELNSEKQNPPKIITTSNISNPNAPTIIAKPKAKNNATSSSDPYARLNPYYDAIDKLALASNSNQPNSVLISMKSVLMACKEITQEAESLENNYNLSDSIKNQLQSAKDSLSSTLGILLDLAKEHASGRSSPESLDSAIDGLTEAMQDLNDAMNTENFSNSNQIKNDYSSYNSLPKAHEAHASSARDTIIEKNAAMDITELKQFLEEHTDDIAYTIQDLLQSMRSKSSSGSELKKFMKKVIDNIDTVAIESKNTFSNVGSSSLVSDANPLISQLLKSRDELEELSNQILEQPGSKVLKQKIANSSYEIAKNVKELLNLLE